jgi:hypothetical protein
LDINSPVLLAPITANSNLIVDFPTINKFCHGVTVRKAWAEYHPSLYLLPLSIFLFRMKVTYPYTMLTEEFGIER